MKIEGRNAVYELIKTEKTIDKILIQNGIKDELVKLIAKDSALKNYKYQFVEKALLDKESETKRHQGFIAYVSDYKYTDFDELIKSLEQKERDRFLISRWTNKESIFKMKDKKTYSFEEFKSYGDDVFQKFIEVNGEEFSLSVCFKTPLYVDYQLITGEI